MRSRLALLVAGPMILVTACTGGDGDAGSVDTTSTPPATEQATTTEAAAPTTAGSAVGPATFEVRPSVEQLHVLGAEPGGELELVDGGDDVVAIGNADDTGALLFRAVTAGSYVVRTTGEPIEQSGPVTVTSVDDTPDESLYENQEIGVGFGYITTRDGTTLSANVVLPGPIDAGPYPTVVEYSGYTPSNPDDATFAQIYTTLGYAYVGVNIRGSGCSGGAFGFFEPIQGLDGYDVIETVAAQPWVEHGHVGMVGVSYPGISQLFVARTRPPHLAAITPLSVLDDSYRSTLYPGGILNTGFAVPWSEEREREAEVFGQDWAKQRADAGDDVCAANQELRGQNQAIGEMVAANEFYDPAIGDAIAPVTFVGDIDVPVFLAGAWQDEQTGGRFPRMLDAFDSSPQLYATMLNGTHTESLSLGIFPRYVEFLDLYVAKRQPDLAAAAAVGPVLAGALTGVDGLAMPPGVTAAAVSYEDALARFEAQPRVRILFEQGAADGTAPGTPLPRFEAAFDAWPVPQATPRTWWLGAGELLDAAVAEEGTVSYEADPAAVAPTFYEDSQSAIWAAQPAYDWQIDPEGTSAVFTTEDLPADTVVVGTGAVHLRLRADAPDTDVEVTISEIRPDGSEVYVQSGWLRASHRALAASATELVPAHSHLEADVEPLPAGEFVDVSVELFPVAHAFRAGSRIRLAVGAPGGNRPIWAFDTLSAGETVELAFGSESAARLVLPVVEGVDVPPGVPACGALRSQPCRTVGDG